MMNRDSSTQSGCITRKPILLEVFAWLLPLTLAMGSDFLIVTIGGVSFYAYRMVVILVAFFAIADLFLKRRTIPAWVGVWFVFYVAWLLWSLFHRPASIHHEEWMKGVFYIVMAGASLLSFYFLAIAGAQKVLVFASVGGFVINCGVSILQMVTSIRPIGSFSDQLMNYSPEHFVRFAPAGMFGNPNHFAFYTCAQLFIIYTFRRYLPFTLRALLYVVGALLLLLTHSRLGVLSMSCMVFMMLIENRSWLAIQASRAKKEIVIPCMIAVLAIATTNWLNTRTVALKQHGVDGKAVQVKSSGDASRWNLLSSGYDMLTASGMMGIGAGQFAKALEDTGCFTGGIYDPHSGFMEIAVEAGVFIFALMMCALVAFVVSSIKKPFALQAFIWLVMVCVLQFANSTFVAIPIAWSFMAWPFLISFQQTDDTLT